MCDFGEMVLKLGDYNCGLIHSLADGGGWSFVYAPDEDLPIRCIAVGRQEDLEFVLTSGLRIAAIAQSNYDDQFRNDRLVLEARMEANLEANNEEV